MVHAKAFSKFSNSAANQFWILFRTQDSQLDFQNKAF